jgi:membrane-associated protease RseP (regulator of RpoE activity)
MSRSRKLAFAIVIAVCLAIGYYAIAGTRSAPAGTGRASAGSRASLGRGGGPSGRPGAQNTQHKPLVVPEGYEKLVITVQPGGGQKPANAKGDVAGGESGSPKAKGQAGAPAQQQGGRAARRGSMMMGGGGHSGGCPQTEMNQYLGVKLSQPHGCIVGNVLPKGLAGKAGIKPGDSIVEANGVTVTCPSTFAPVLMGIDGSHGLKLTVLRKKAEASPTAARSGAASAHSAPKAPAAKTNKKPAGK